MASAKTTSTTAIQPPFKRVESSEFDTAFACIAMVCNKSMADVVAVAVEKFGHPAKGPYWITEGLIQKLLAHWGLLATNFKEMDNGVADIKEDVALCMVEYDDATDVGRFVLFVRDRSNPKQPLEYAIDPAGWVSPDLHLRQDWPQLMP